jgi:outer membrane protein assembly factor BamD (BamD/ComL family)
VNQTAGIFKGRIPATTLLLVAVLVSSCHRRAVQPVVPPPSPTPSVCDVAEKSFEAGNYQAAVNDYEACLRANYPKDQDRVYFRLGLAYAISGNSSQNLRLSRAHLQRIARQFPNSPYRAPAELILSLQTQIEKLGGDLKEQERKIKTLTEELQRLKAIDMQRKPSRPPHDRVLSP